MMIKDIFYQKVGNKIYFVLSRTGALIISFLAITIFSVSVVLNLMSSLSGESLESEQTIAYRDTNDILQAVVVPRLEENLESSDEAKVNDLIEKLNRNKLK